MPVVHRRGAGWLLCALTAMLGASAPTAFAAFPGPLGSDPWLNRPNDPDYREDWNLFSHIPVDHVGLVSPFEQRIGSGMSVDKAWQLHTGTPSTIIAVLDSGIIWEQTDLVDQVALNTGELPKPLGSQVYDHNGDGRIAPSDYANDSRVHGSGRDGHVTAGDLIRAFSDGVDDDHDGYVDNIAGWDFHEGRNDPADRVLFGHGTGEASDSTGGLDNGIGSAGVCGHCSFMPLRINDSFVADGNAFARAVIYATDHGASVIQEALGSINWSPFVQQAIDYAYAHDVVIIGSSADENSYHHNFPAALDPVIYVNALRYDSDNPKDATTFLNLNSCSNYGARVDVAASGKSCSSEATGKLAGIAGLAVSYAKSLGRSLSAGELIALLKGTATDIALGSNANHPDRWPTWQGWDQITGYGRANAYALLDAIRRDAVPSEARILSPDWFAVFAGRDAASTPVPVVVQVRPRAGVAVKLKLEVARGVETSASSWLLLQETPLLPTGFSGKLADLNMPLLAGLVASPRDSAHDREAAYTLRLTVIDAAGRVSEARRSFFYWQDQRLLPGFPRRLSGSGESSGVVLADFAGAPAFVTADGGGLVHAFRADGREAPGFPAPTAVSRYNVPPTAAAKGPVYASVFAPIAAGDLAGDGQTAVVAVSSEGQISVLGSDGRMRPGFPVSLPTPDMRQVGPTQVIAPGALAAPVLIDLDRSGKLAIVVAALDGQVHAYRQDGSVQPGFPVALLAEGRRAKTVSSPAAADLDGDGIPDLILGSNHEGAAAGYIFAVNGRGHLAARPMLPGFPSRIPVLRDKILPTIGTGIPAAPVVADFYGDGRREILIHGFAGKTYIIGADGRIVQSLDLRVPEAQPGDDPFMITAFGQPAVGDIGGDGQLRPVAVGAGNRLLTALALAGRKIDFHHLVGAWDPRSGHLLPGFPKVNDDMALAVAPTLADVDGSGKLAVLAGSGGYYLHAWTQAGEAPGFPLFTGGWIFGSASLGDLAGDGSLSVTATTREGYVFAWRTDGKAAPWQGQRGWLTFKGNPQRTGAK